jgi:glycosyltransferase involved in cell wall biosynthesis
MNLSILIPLLNEDESLKELYTWIISIMKSNNYSYEIIFIDDGSSDNSWTIIEELASENPNVKGIRFMKLYMLDLQKLKAMSLLRWMPIYKIALRKFPDYMK